MAVIGYHTGFVVDNVTDGRSFGLGDRFCDHVGNEYVYVQASEAITQYDFVGVDENFQCAQLTATEAGDGWMIGVAQVAFTDNDYGFVAVRGADLTGRVAASCAADAALYTTATAGVVDDATGGTKIDGIVAVSTNTETVAASEEVLLTFPRSATF